MTAPTVLEEGGVLTDDDKPDAIRMGGTTEDWWKAAQQS